MLPLLLACTQSDYTFLSAEEDPSFQATEDLGGGGALAAWERTTPDAPAEREEVFLTGSAPTAIADYLLVIDESVSMRNVIEDFQAGVGSLLAPGVFPRASRLAVINTTPGDPDDLTRPHPETRPIPGETFAPGFLRLVDRDGIAQYRTVAPDRLRRRYRRAGCEAWFAPRQRNDTGTPCLIAHTQIGRTAVGAEAGLVALSQWVEQTAGQPRFRPGAAVNVVFISDTHDPGLDSEALRALQPDIDALVAFIEEDDTIASFRMHAIAPEADCSEAWEEPSYFLAAAATDGVTADICTTTDYAAVIGQIARSGAFTQRPIYALGYPADEVLSVTLDGEPIAHDIAADGAVVVLPERPERAGLLRIRYQRPALATH